MLDITKRSDTVLGQSGVQVAYDVLELEHNRAPSKGTVVLLHGAGIINQQGRQLTQRRALRMQSLLLAGRYVLQMHHILCLVANR